MRFAEWIVSGSPQSDLSDVDTHDTVGKAVAIGPGGPVSGLRPTFTWAGLAGATAAQTLRETDYADACPIANAMPSTCVAT